MTILFFAVFYFAALALFGSLCKARVALPVLPSVALALAKSLKCASVRSNAAFLF